jgi:hypothetical protein
MKKPPAGAEGLKTNYSVVLDTILRLCAAI